MLRLPLILLPFLLLGCGSSPPMTATPVSATSIPSIPAPLLAPMATAIPTPSSMCEMNTECFWQAYQQCATHQSAHLVVHLAGPTLVHGDTVTGWRNILLHYTGDTCTIFVADQTSAVLSNGNIAGGPGPGYDCMDLTRDPNDMLHITGCSEGSTPSNNIDVPPHG